MEYFRRSGRIRLIYFLDYDICILAGEKAMNVEARL